MKNVLDAGYVPVLHGDCTLDLEQHCCILSGDTVIEVLAKTFSPRRVVFLTDVNGIYSCPPDTPGTEQRDELKMHSYSDPEWKTSDLAWESARLVDSIVIGPERTMEPAVLTSALPHDSTGGVSLKLQTAINIVSSSHGSIPVLICKLDSEAAVKACLTGELKEGEGTKLSFVDT
ncbi:hypothetical protein E2320_009850 [Naja naja]|nr:hypothetical protein E2320_009850 [Naja naja]